MFVWANELLDNYPCIADALRYRFPLLFIDEVQDNSEGQSALLHRIFIEGNTPVIRQRFGDMNQAIFGYTGQDAAATDTFPAQAVIWPIPNSHRFGQQIADFANPFAIVPQGLVGRGPSGNLIRTDAAGKHTIFLFDDATLPFVMDAYANYLAEIFTSDELRWQLYSGWGGT
jgi:DNA helicase II / ATP-dependent DNA helicase PcrA